MAESLIGPTVCFSCGRKHRGIHAVGCANDNLKVCSECFIEYGEKELRAEGDRLLADFFAAHNRPRQQGGKCGHCGEWSPELVMGLICPGCERERQLLISTGGRVH